VASDRQRIVAAAQRYGHTVDGIAHRYTNPVTGKPLSGTALLLKVMQGESGALSNPGAARTKVSPRGARGWTQFMPSSRATAVKNYGIDPWRSPEEAVHAAALHLRGKINGHTGLEGYNPGDPTYPAYILRQRVGQYVRGTPRTVAPGGGGPAGATVTVGSRASGFSGQGGQLAAMLQALTTPGATRIQGTAPTPPSFTAQAVVPKGFQVPDAGAVTQAPAVLDQATAAQLAAAAAGDQQDLTVPTYSVTGGGGGGGGAQGPYTPGKQIAGAIHYSPIPGAPVLKTPSHDTMGLPGFPAHDYMAPAGTRVVAPVNGTVYKLSGKDPKLGGPAGGPLGYSVYIKGDNGKRYYLTHMDKIGVKVGQRIRRGTQIAVVAHGYGAWGNATHVHMGVSG
jgi:murein DD-endopeptidase MepM/ murein hydrolase activator NlpD